MVGGELECKGLPLLSSSVTIGGDIDNLDNEAVFLKISWLVLTHEYMQLCSAFSFPFPPHSLNPS